MLTLNLINNNLMRINNMALSQETQDMINNGIASWLANTTCTDTVVTACLSSPYTCSITPDVPHGLAFNSSACILYSAPESTGRVMNTQSFSISTMQPDGTMSNANSFSLLVPIAASSSTNYTVIAVDANDYSASATIAVHVNGTYGVTAEIWDNAFL